MNAKSGHALHPTLRCGMQGTLCERQVQLDLKTLESQFAEEQENTEHMLVSVQALETSVADLQKKISEVFPARQESSLPI